MKNPQMHLAQEFIRATNNSVFLTGKAGTGKTTFLHRLKQRPPKRMVITAPTGVAAIQARGVTLHSFFQLPFGPFVPGSEVERRAAEHRFGRQKRDLIRSLDLLVIDEISMVRADLLDAVDFVLRQTRGSERPFGGVQLLMIGDLHQLPPVVRDEDWSILRDLYDSGYFFSSRALRETAVISIALEHIYRQSDADFIDLLNRVRDNQLDDRALERLNARHRPDFEPRDSEGYITLTSHNQSADRINQTRLQGLGGKPHSFTAEIQGEYPEHSFPTAKRLTLKQGAQVMFVRNDSALEGRYFNGKIGTLSHLERDCILVRCPGDSEPIEVEPVTWENIRYSIDPQTQAISEEVMGRFVQYPLRLAWAITIHKSQGLTFERAIIDAGAAFSHGQVYVALSRCKTFEGLVLSTPIPRRAVMTDQRVSHYVTEASRHPPTQEQLDQARIAYQQRLLQECWDFDRVGVCLRKLLGLLRENRRVIDVYGVDPTNSATDDAMHEATGDAMHNVEQQTLEQVVSVGAKFRRQIQSLYRADQIPEEDAYLQERVRKASAYFSDQLQRGLLPWLESFSFGTDNKALGKAVRQAVDDLQEALVIKTACLESCRERFTTAAYLNAVATAQLAAKTRGAGGAKSSRADDVQEDLEGPGLLAALRRWRAQKADEEERDGVTRYRILTRAVLRQIAETLPDSPEALAAIKGIGKRTVARYGNELLAIVADHCHENGRDPDDLRRLGR